MYFGAITSSKRFFYYRPLVIPFAILSSDVEKVPQIDLDYHTLHHTLDYHSLAGNFVKVENSVTFSKIGIVIYSLCIQNKQMSFNFH